MTSACSQYLFNGSDKICNRHLTNGSEILIGCAVSMRHKHILHRPVANLTDSQMGDCYAGTKFYKLPFNIKYLFANNKANRLK